MRRRTLLGAGVAVTAGVLGAHRPAYAWPGPYLTVAADGTGDVTDIQAAVDAVPAGNPGPFTIKIRPGVYRGRVVVPADKPYVVLRGQGDDPSAVVIADDRANGTPRPDGGTWGTSGSASVTISGAGFAARNLTFANLFDEAAHPEITNRQAVAVLTRADRLVFDNVRFLGNQDTLYVNTPDVTVASRAYFRKCYIEGDVDFVFGRGTAVFDRCELRSLSRGSTTNNGYVTAASTDQAVPYGFLVWRSRLTGTAAAGTVSLGRPWHPGNDPAARPSTVIRDSWLGPHVRATPWSDFGTWSWRDARYAEYANRGPGAGLGPDRPQLTAQEADRLTPGTWLAGADGWNPLR
ncbi:pectinesterase family protein [Micromonospora sp. KC723]|uniref:pectinesterase family protein n=1 Tax=Micromonospora sp. KC723 TaxID=2530381 RepID=UPI001049E147|nr:pectinesterase family protein [Micromonospora sp. KC723]TDB77679.1 pectin esterase [Micromonospora sp. KC723]